MAAEGPQGAGIENKAEPDEAESEASRLTGQGYRLLESVAAARSPQEAVELSSAALNLFQQALSASGNVLEEQRTAKRAQGAAYSQRGHQQRYAGNHTAAAADLSEAIKLNPASAEDYFYRAQSFLKLSNEEAAGKDFTEYLRRGEDDYLRQLARDELATLALKVPDMGVQAAQWSRDGIRFNTEAANVLLPRGTARPEPARAVALYNQALEAFKKALAANPKDVITQLASITALSEQAECYLQMEEYDLAIDNFNRAYNIRPVPKYLFKRGEAYRAAGHNEEARADFEKFVETGKDQDLKMQAQKYLEEKPKPGVEA